ncbi:hypothetical protein [Streptomyces noursei]|uniref:hypothetical protein n=1 Tax=Streptomyces noursei TaxID=1971 RepID=UPI00082C0532
MLPAFFARVSSHSSALISAAAGLALSSSGEARSDERTDEKTDEISDEASRDAKRRRRDEAGRETRLPMSGCLFRGPVFWSAFGGGRH